MKKIIKLEGLCCANCAAKIEDGVKKVPGVKAARKIADKIEPEAEFKVLR